MGKACLIAGRPQQGLHLSCYSIGLTNLPTITLCIIEFIIHFSNENHVTVSDGHSSSRSRH